MRISDASLEKSQSAQPKNSTATRRTNKLMSKLEKRINLALHSSGNENIQEVQDKSHQSNLQASKSDESQVPSIDFKSASVPLPD